MRADLSRRPTSSVGKWSRPAYCGFCLGNSLRKACKMNFSTEVRRQRWRARKAAQRAFPLVDQRCADCGAANNLQRHHPNHARPIDIIILCQSCHTQREVIQGTWGRGPVHPCACRVCGVQFIPDRNRHAVLCGKRECREELGRRCAEKRWSGHEKITSCTCCGVRFERVRARQTTCSRSCGNKLAWEQRRLRAERESAEREPAMTAHQPEPVS